MAGAAQGNFNQLASQGMQGAQMGTAMGMAYQPQQVGAAYGQAATYNPAQAGYTGYNAAQAGATGYNAATMGAVPMVQAGQLANTNLSAYTNPYESQVVSGLQSDAQRAAQMASNDIGTAATRAGAFGGSRHGVTEGTMLAENQRNLSNQIAGLRQAGFQNAQQMAQQDIATRMQAGLANQGAGMQAALTNIGALNQAGQFGASAANQAALQNAAAVNQARGFGAGAANTAALQNMAAANQAGQFGAGAQNTMTQQNMANFMQSQLANQQAGLAGAQQRLGAANQLGGISQNMYNMNRQANLDMQQAGLQQQAIQQAIIDAGKGQYAGFTGAPAAALSYLGQALGGAAGMVPQTTTNAKQAGLFDYLTLAAMAPKGTFG